jgi:hypothetical protein
VDDRPDVEMRKLNPLTQLTPACVQQRRDCARVQRIRVSFTST